MFLSDFPYQREDSNAVHNHGQGVSLGHYLLSVKEVTHAPHIADNQHLPVVVLVKCELRTNVTLKPDIKKHVCPVLLIERIVRVNEKEPPTLLLGIILHSSRMECIPP